MVVPRRLLVGMAVTSLLILGACGDDDGADAAPTPDATTETGDTGAPVADGDDGPPDAPADDATGAAGPEERPVIDAASVLALFDGLDQLDGDRFGSTTVVSDGDAVVMWFWAPWCPTCRAIAPTVAEVSTDLAAQDHDVVFVGVAGQGSVGEMEEFVGSTGTGDILHVVDADGSAWAEFGVLTQPTFALVTPDGAVDLLVRPDRDQLVERIAGLHGG